MSDVTKEELKKHITDIVKNNPGIKGVDLALRLLDRTMPSYLDKDIYQQSLSELIIENGIMELEYVVPGMEYRIKSLYFPIGTQIKAA